MTGDYPRNSEAIRQQPKMDSPKRFSKRRANGSSFRQLGKETFCIGLTGIERDAKSPRRLIRAWRGVGSLQSGIADDQRGVSNLAAPFSGHIQGGGRIAPGEHERNLAVQAAFVELECGFALPVKRKIDARLQGHQAHYRGPQVRSLVKMGARERSMP